MDDGDVDGLFEVHLTSSTRTSRLQVQSSHLGFTDHQAYAFFDSLLIASRQVDAFDAEDFW